MWVGGEKRGFGPVADEENKKENRVERICGFLDSSSNLFYAHYRYCSYFSHLQQTDMPYLLESGEFE